MNKRVFLKLLGLGAAIKATCQKVWGFPFLTDRKCELGDNTPEPAPNDEVAKPVRRAGSSWNFEGRWNPSRQSMIDHLVDDHHVTIDLTKYTTAELRLIHNNVHNGYGPLGQGCGRRSKTTSRRRGWFWR